MPESGEIRSQHRLMNRGRVSSDSPRSPVRNHSFGTHAGVELQIRISITRGWSTMKNLILVLTMVIITPLLNNSASLHAQTVLNVETGIVSTGYNDIRIPGDKGTLFSLNDDLSAKSTAFIRLRGSYTFNSRHTVSILYAPLVVDSDGKIAKQIDFAGATFPSNTIVNASYKFNSYRLTYRYDIVSNSKTELGLGFTAKIRDAKIELRSAASLGEKKNVGFVPIIHFRLLWRFHDSVGLLIDGDALAAPQGRAEDVRIAVEYRLSEHLGLSAGYRILEGGADNDEVYSFALFHYASCALSYAF